MNLPIEIRRLDKRIKGIEKILNINEQPADTKTVEEFLEETCQRGSAKKIEAKVLYGHFEKWLDTKELIPFVSNRTFYYLLKVLGYEVRRGTRNKVYVFGVNLKQVGVDECNV